MVCNRANKGDGAEWGPSALGGDSSHAALAKAFVALGIDDLAKFHVVRLLYQRPALAGNADYYARYLGFHSTTVTRGLLDELVATGLLMKGSEPAGVYRLAEDGDLLRRLIRLYNATEDPLEQEAVLRLLASRSLRKAQSRAVAKERPNVRALNVLD